MIFRLPGIHLNGGVLITVADGISQQIIKHSLQLVGITGQQHIERMLDKSLQNLGMDHVDLYIYHMWDYQTPLYDVMEGLDRMVKAGKVRYIGISNCFAYQLAKANALAEKEGFARFVSVQGITT